MGDRAGSSPASDTNWESRRNYPAVFILGDLSWSVESRDSQLTHTKYITERLTPSSILEKVGCAGYNLEYSGVYYMSTLSAGERNIVELFVDHLNRTHPGEVDKVVLYGSRARGDNRRDSDVDILVLVKDKKRINRERIYDFVIDAELEHGIDISVNIYESGQFNQLVLLNAPFASNVIKEGETLWTQ